MAADDVVSLAKAHLEKALAAQLSTLQCYFRAQSEALTIDFEARLHALLQGAGVPCAAQRRSSPNSLLRSLPVPPDASPRPGKLGNGSVLSGLRPHKHLNSDSAGSCRDNNREHDVTIGRNQDNLCIPVPFEHTKLNPHALSSRAAMSSDGAPNSSPTQPPSQSQTVVREEFLSSIPGHTANQSSAVTWEKTSINSHMAPAVTSEEDHGGLLNTAGTDLATAKVRESSTSILGLPVTQIQSRASIHRIEMSNPFLHHVHRPKFGSGRLSRNSDIAIVQNLPAKDQDKLMKIVDKIQKKRTAHTISRNLTKSSSSMAFRNTVKSSDESRDLSRKLFDRTGPHNQTLEVAIGAVIMLSTVAMVVELEYQGYKSQVVLGTAKAGAWIHADICFKLLEHVFNALFLIEMAFNLWVLRRHYFQDVLYIADFIVIVSSSIQIYILDNMDVVWGGNILVFRVLRFARFVRLLKLIRMQLFTELRVMVKTCISSMYSLVWSMVLLGGIITMAGLFICSLLKNHIQDDTFDHKMRMWLWKHYGTPARSAYTLFQVTLSGCWPNYFSPLIENVSGWYVLYVVVYISIVVFAVLRIITATFIKETLKVATQDSELVVNEQRGQFDRTVAKLGFIFRTIDTKGEGEISYEDFVQVLANKDVRALLQVMELEVHDIQGLFDMLDNGQGVITYQDFLHGILRLKGQAKSLDVIAIACHCDRMEDLLREVMGYVSQLHQWQLTSHPRSPRKRDQSCRSACSANTIQSSLPSCARSDASPFLNLGNGNGAACDFNGHSGLAGDARRSFCFGPLSTAGTTFSPAASGGM